MVVKKYSILFVVLLTSLSLWGQKTHYWISGSPYTLKGTYKLPESEKYVLLDFDFSETLFEKRISVADWAILNGEEEWEKAKQEALEIIVEVMNKEMTQTRIIFVLNTMNKTGTKKIDSNYTLFIKPIELNKKGKNKSEFVLKDTSTGEILGSVVASGPGVHFGSLGNMLGEGYERNAPVIAKIIQKENKLPKK